MRESSALYFRCDGMFTHAHLSYAAAKDLGSNFKLFLSYDMAVLPCGGPNDAALLRKYVTDFADHPNQLKVDGKVFASTFG
jgi:glucan endo-1,3-alpha-glucosidase